MTPAARADIAVIGGGIVGSAIAWRLGSAGHRVNWIVDSGATDGAGAADGRGAAGGSGPTGSASAAAGAMLAVHSEVIPHDAGPVRAVELAARGAGRAGWDEWLPQLGVAAGRAVPVPVSAGIFVIGTAVPADVEGLAAIREAAAADGAAVHDVALHDVPGLEPETDAGVCAAIHLPGEASVDGGALLSALRTGTLALPSVQATAEQVVGLAVGHSGVTIRCASGTVLTVDQVVLAAGVQTGRLLADSGLDELLPPLFGGRGVSLVLRAEHPVPHCIRTPNRAFACGLHLVPRGPGSTYLGATNRLSTRPDLGVAPRLEEIVDLVRGGVRELQTGLRNAELLSASAGHRPVTLDRLPLAGRTAEPRVLVATGTWRNGVVLAPMLADLIASEIDQPGTAAGHAFAPTRSVDREALTAALARPDAIRRAAAGIVGGLIGPGGVAAGRLTELTDFVETALTAHVVGDSDVLRRTIGRLLRQAPMEEALPLVYDLIARR